VLHEIVRPTECSDHPPEAFGRPARFPGDTQGRERGSGVGGETTEHQHLGSERVHDFIEPAIAERTGEPSDRLGYLKCVAR
jgi:hypothetical protein